MGAAMGCQPIGPGHANLIGTGTFADGNFVGLEWIITEAMGEAEQ